MKLNLIYNPFLTRWQGLARFALLCGFLALGFCTPKDELFDPSPSSPLRFSTDTVNFDTVFTGFRTVTRRVRIFNTNKRTIQLEYVKVASQSSTFRIIVNGRPGPSTVENIDIRGGDSVLVLIEAFIDPRNANNPFIIEDSIMVKVRGRNDEQRIIVLCWGEDAHYLDGEILECTGSVITWDSVKPYVIYNSILVPKNCTLRIREGTRIHSFKNSNIFIEGFLLVEGKRGQPVIFTGTRLEPFYQNIPDQWGAIVLLNESVGAIIEHAVIQNGFRGVQVGLPGGEGSKPFLRMSNTIVRNFSDVGIYGFTGGVFLFNCVIADCAQSLFAGLQGGLYEIWHSTLAYTGINNFQRQTPAVAFADFFDDPVSQTRFVADLNVKLVSNIITGSQREELVFAPSRGATTWDTLFLHNIIRGSASRSSAQGNQMISRDLRFPGAPRYDFALDSIIHAAAINKGAFPIPSQRSDLPVVIGGTTYINNTLRTDFIGTERGQSAEDLPDIGAYEFRIE